MKVQRLQIEQQMAKIDIESTKPVLKIDMPKREMQIETKNAEMTLDMEQGGIEIDMTAFRNNMGVRSISDFSSENIADAKVGLEQRRREYSADGDMVASLPSNGNSIAQVALKNLLATDMPEMNSGKVPEKPVRVSGQPGKIDINWSKSDIVIKWGKYEPPEITVEPKASVNVELAQEPIIECEVVEMEIPPETGRMIDLKA
jgi:hypothetical protein